jgi:uncharacterized protein YkwD
MTRLTYMKSLVGKLIIAGLLVAMVVTFYPQVKPLVNHALSSRGVQLAKPVAPPPGVKYLAKVEDLIFDLTNQARLARGLAPLARDDELGNVARAFSNDMLVRRFFDHTTPEGLPFEKRLANQYRHWVHDMGENIWSGSGYAPRETQELAQEIVNDWLNSPGHRENLLDPDFTHLGVGVSARHDRIRATQEFVGRFKLWPLSI